MGWSEARVCIHKDTDFNRQISRLSKHGGRSLRAAEEVTRILSALRAGRDPGAALFNSPEPAIPNGFRYDLLGKHRLILARHEDTLWFVYVGTQVDVEAWIAQNRGLRLAINPKTAEIHPVQPMTVGSAAEPQPLAPVRVVFDEDKPLLDLLEQKDRLRLGLSRLQEGHLKKLTRVSSNEDVLEAVLDAFTTEVDQSFFLGIFRSLRDRPQDSARQLIGIRFGEVVEATNDPQALAKSLDTRKHDGVRSEALIDLRDLSEGELAHLFTSSSFRDWLLYLHPDQRRVANERTEKPTFLQGVSGSGKTCVLVHRALHLAQTYPGKRIGIFTLNRALASLIKELVDVLVPAKLRPAIEVKAIYDLGKEIVAHFDSSRLVREHDPKSGETVDLAWTDFFVKLQDRGTLDATIDSLHKQKVDFSRYLRDELIWVRSAFGMTSTAVDVKIPARDAYCDPAKAGRKGREIPFRVDWRKGVITELVNWEEYLDDGGLVDPAGMTLAAHGFIPRLRSGDTHPFRYRCVLVDEVQDLASIELELVHALVDASKPDSLFLAGDSKQQVFPKEHDLRKAGLDDLERRFFRKNYRNPKQILEAGVALLERYGGNDVDGDDLTDLQRPEYSARQSARPLYVRASSEEQERRFVIAHLRAKLKRDDNPICVVVCGIRDDAPHEMEQVRKLYVASGLECRLLSETSLLSPKTVFLSALETVKGFEFSLVLITRCTSKFMPDRSMPKQEHWRDARRLYVALTRARDEAVLTHSGEASEYLEGIHDLLQWRDADEELS